jgi:hypothetical protein
MASYGVANIICRAFEADDVRERGGGRGGIHHGGAVQVDSIKPESKARLVSAIETKM